MPGTPEPTTSTAGVDTDLPDPTAVSGTSFESTSSGGSTATTTPQTTGVTTTIGEGDSSSSGTDTAATTTGERAVCPTFFDDFEDAAEGPRWIQSDPGFTSESDGLLRFDITPPDDIFALMLLDPGSFENASMRMEVAEAPAHDGVFLMLWIEQAVGLGRIAYRVAQREGALLLEARITSEEGGFGVVVEATDWDPVAHHWLQLRDEDGALFFEASPDGEEFTTVFELGMQMALDDVLVGFAGFNNEVVPEDVEVSVDAFGLDCAE